MFYSNIKRGIFLQRPNRFIAHVSIDGKTEIAHVKNTGRCKELLIPGVTVYLQQHSDPKRKTAWSLIAVEKGDRLINIDSQAPNKVFYEWLKSGKFFEGITFIKPEAKYGNSRFDFYVETLNEKLFIEVKGVTLEHDNIVLFPDAPTERGVKHIRELAECLKEGYTGYIVFVIQMADVEYFTPNAKTHKEFADTLKKAAAQGVKVLALDCIVRENELQIGKEVGVKLEQGKI